MIDRKSPQIWILLILSILADLNSAVVWSLIWSLEEELKPYRF